MYNDIISKLEVMLANDNDRVINFNKKELTAYSTELATRYHLKNICKVGDVVIYISTTNVGNMFFETMIFNIDFEHIKKGENIEKYIDWDSQYGFYRADTIDEATKNHAKVIDMLAELNRRLNHNRVEVKNSLCSNMLSVIKRIFNN